MSINLMKPRILQRKRYINLLFSIALIICSAVYAAGQASDARIGPMFKSTDSGNSWAAINMGMSAWFINALALDPVTPEIIYAGSDRGIFKSTDGGATWTVPNGDITLFRIESIAINPVTPSNIYAGTFGGGVYKSTDGGITWSRINNGLPLRKLVRRIIIDPINPSILYLENSGSIFKSNNGGGNWELVLKLPLTGDQLFPVDLILDPRNPSTVYVIGSGRVYKSTDSGGDWKEITGQIIIPHLMVIDPVNPSTLYIVNFQEVAGLFKSTNGGSTWTGITLNNLSLTRTAIFQLAIDPVSSSTLYLATSQGVFKSIDGGSNWVETGLSINNGFFSSVFSLALNPINPSTIYAGTGGGVSPNDSPWIRSVEVSGKKLIVTGESFDNGAVILLDGNPQKTINDAESSIGRLISKKAGKKVKNNPEIRIQIRNANGKLSQTVVRPVD